MSNLIELFDNVVEFQNYNGVPLAAGKLYVFALGRTRLMDTWSDVDGESLNPNPIILDDLGQCHCYVSDSFDYTIVVCDQFDNEIFSVDKYLLSKGEHSHADVAVAPSEHIGVSSYNVGDVTIYVPYLTGEVGKTYEGILPIVVNNDLNRISAQHIPLGVQDPLYFVEDSESACILGCSAQTEIPSALSGKWDEASDAVIANSAQWAEGTEYEAGNYISIDNNVINVTGLSPIPADTASTGLVAEVSADITAMIPDTSDMATQTWVNEQGFLTAHQSLDGLMSSNLLEFSGSVITSYSGYKFAGEISGDAGDAEVNALVHSNSATWDNVTAKLDTTAFSDVSGTFLTAHQSLQGYATEQWVEGKGYITGVNIPESANWNATTNTVSSNSAAWASATPQIPVTGINGIKISESGDKVVFEVSGNYLQNTDLTIVDNKITEISGVPLSAGDELPESVSAATDYITATSGNINATITNVSENSAAWGGDALPISARDGIDLEISDDKLWIGASALNEALTGKQDITGMTAYQPVGDYLTTADSTNFYTTANESGFITGVDLTPYQTIEGMTAYQPVGDYLTTGDSGNFYTTANESGFLTAVPETYLQNTDLEISDNKITGISGVPLAAGGEVPQGVMVESGLEYDTDNKISGYNGSAFAGEEQVQSDWTVTAVDNPAYILNKPTEKNLIAGANVTITESNDDVTIETTEIASGLQLVAGPGVTLTVSGSNIVAAADETVLWSGTQSISSTAIRGTLSEKATNFERIGVYWRQSYSNINGFLAVPTQSIVTGQSYVSVPMSQFGIGGPSDGSLYCDRGNVAIPISGDSLEWSAFGPFSRMKISGTSITYDASRGPTMSKIIGINRISS